MIATSILGSGSVLPGRAVTTAEICARAFPHRTAADLEARTGIATRWFHEEGETVASLAARCLKSALEDAGLEASALRRIILVSSFGFDHPVPATVNDVAVALGLRNTCDGFDLQNGCMGFLSALDVAARCTATGLEPVAVVASELLSASTDPSDPRPYAVLGDAAGAVVLGRGDGKSGVLGSHFGNDGVLGDSVTLAKQRHNGERELVRFGGSNERITGEALSSILKSSEAAVKEARLRIEDMDWFLIHQPNGVMFQKVAAALGAPAERLIPVVREIGSVGAASIAFSLDRLRRSGKASAGQIALLTGVGSGLAYGAMVVRL